MNLTKSHFLTYLDAPMHLWAEVNNKFEKPLSVYDLHLMKEGYKVEKLAKEYLESLVSAQSDQKLFWQQTYTDHQYEVKADALIYKSDTDTYDLYEIKSSTAVDKTNLYDATFQFLVLNKQVKIDRVFILHLNKDYVCHGSLNLAELFIAEDITDQIEALKIEVDIEREHALAILSTQDHTAIAACLNPKTCRCPSLCHPDLPDFSIFNIPGLSKAKKQALLDLGIIKAQDVPDNFALSYKQSLVVKVAKTNQPIINQELIRHELERLTLPLYFLDYETYNSAIPMFDGYHPQQQMVFQYSLHILDQLDGQIRHTEHLSLEAGDPARSLIQQLHQDIGQTGSIIVWNKTFEAGRNQEMAEIYPDYADFLTDLNERIYDLADSIKEGFYVHPQFKGSWSIKNVLPVMVPSLSYQDMAIGKGDQAMMAWWGLVNKSAVNPEQVKNNLLKYCELDTWAMVEVWMRFVMSTR